MLIAKMMLLASKLASKTIRKKEAANEAVRGERGRDWQSMQIKRLFLVSLSTFLINESDQKSKRATKLTSFFLITPWWPIG